MARRRSVPSSKRVIAASRMAGTKRSWEPPPRAFARVHRRVRVAQQVRRRVAVLGDRDADARPRAPPRRRRRRAARARADRDPLGDLLGVARDRPRPRAGTRTRRRRGGPPCRRGATVVRSRSPTSCSSWSPAWWPRLSLIALKSSRSTNSTTTPAVLPAAPLQRVRDAVGEQRAVGEPRERVVERLARQLRLEHLALGDVAVVDDDAADRRVVEQVAPDRLHRPPRAVRVVDPELEPALGAVPRREIGQRLLHGRAVLVVDERREWEALPVAGLDAEDPLHGHALVAHAAVGVEDRLGVGRVLQQRAEARLAPAQVRGELHESPVLPGEHPRRRVERAPQHQQQDRGRQARDDEHVAPRGVDEVDDRGGVLVDLVRADRRPVRGVDGQVDLEEVAGQPDVEHVLLGVRSGRRAGRSTCRRRGRWTGPRRRRRRLPRRPGRSENSTVPEGDQSLIRAMPPGCTRRASRSSIWRPADPPGSPIVASARSGSTLARTVVSALRAASLVAASVTRLAASSAVTSAAPRTSTDATTSTAGRRNGMSRWLRESSVRLLMAVRRRSRFKGSMCSCAWRGARTQPYGDDGRGGSPLLVRRPRCR